MTGLAIWLSLVWLGLVTLCVSLNIREAYDKYGVGAVIAVMAAYCACVATAVALWSHGFPAVLVGSTVVFIVVFFVGSVIDEIVVYVRRRKAGALVEPDKREGA